MTEQKIPDGFLWGGAVAAHQLEGGYDKGGKGISIADVMTAGANGVEREITDGILPERIIRTMKRLISIPGIKKILNFLRKWDSSVSVHP